MEEVSTTREFAGQSSWATRFRVRSPCPSSGDSGGRGETLPDARAKRPEDRGPTGRNL